MNRINKTCVSYLGLFSIICHMTPQMLSCHWFFWHHTHHNRLRVSEGTFPFHEPLPSLSKVSNIKFYLFLWFVTIGWFVLLHLFVQHATWQLHPINKAVAIVMPITRHIASVVIPIAIIMTWLARIHSNMTTRIIFT